MRGRGPIENGHVERMWHAERVRPRCVRDILCVVVVVELLHFLTHKRHLNYRKAGPGNRKPHQNCRPRRNQPAPRLTPSGPCLKHNNSEPSAMIRHHPSGPVRGPCWSNPCMVQQTLPPLAPASFSHPHRFLSLPDPSARCTACSSRPWTHQRWRSAPRHSSRRPLRRGSSSCGR